MTRPEDSTRAPLGAGRLGVTVERWTSIDSTNRRARELAREGAPEGLVVVAGAQTAGRGQHGRSWHSPAGAGLYASFIVRPRLAPREAPSLTLVAGLAVREALAAFTAVPLAVKWPNDVLVAEGGARGRKLAGILIEASADAERIDHLVIGVGVNITEAAFPKEVSGRATSLEALGAEAVRSVVVLGEIARALAGGIERAEAGRSDLVSAFERHGFGVGEQVRLVLGAEALEGRLDGIAPDGALRLTTDAGPHTAHHGDLQLPGVPR